MSTSGNIPPNREVALFSAAPELPAGQRAAYLQEACANDPALRHRLEELLRVHEGGACSPAPRLTLTTVGRNGFADRSTRAISPESPTTLLAEAETKVKTDLEKTSSK